MTPADSRAAAVRADPGAEELAAARRSCLVRVVDDDAQMRRSYEFMLRLDGWKVVSYADARAFLADLPVRGEPGCILLDVRMPGMSGLELQERLIDLECLLPIVFITGHGDVGMAVQAMQLGACDFMQKPVAPDRLKAAVARWCAYSAGRRIGDLRRRAAREDFATLTGREKEVVRLVAEGRTNKAVAEALGISERTVKFHRAAGCRKLGAGSVAELTRVLDALQKGG